MRRIVSLVLIAVLFMVAFPNTALAALPSFKLGNELLLEKYIHLIQGKKVGLITNQSGVNSKGESLIDILSKNRQFQLTALYGPEHGIDGTAKAGAYVESYSHPTLGIPVYSLYGSTRKPTAEMLNNVDVLLFDIQDIGARTYTYISTMNYAMIAAKENDKELIVLDRPNPLGGVIVEGMVLEDPYKTFVGVDNLPMAHGMTIGELAAYFNRNIGAKLNIIPMEGYTRSNIYQDTGLPWVATSPNIPDIASVFGYMATGLGEGTGVYQAEQFKWIGGKGIDSNRFASLLNKANLPGVSFIPEDKNGAGGVRLNITNYRNFNPARTGIFALSYARSLNNFKVPKSGTTMIMFDKIMGTDKMGLYLEKGYTPWQMLDAFQPALNAFKAERQKYLIYGDTPYYDRIIVKVNDKAVNFDTDPYIDANSRLMVPYRAIGEALGAEVVWEAASRSVTLKQAGKTVTLRIGERKALVNGEERLMDTAAVIKNDRTLVPARFVSEFLGSDVEWKEEIRTVIINQ